MSKIRHNVLVERGMQHYSCFLLEVGLEGNRLQTYFCKIEPHFANCHVLCSQILLILEF